MRRTAVGFPCTDSADEFNFKIACTLAPRVIRCRIDSTKRYQFGADPVSWSLSALRRKTPSWRKTVRILWSSGLARATQRARERPRRRPNAPSFEIRVYDGVGFVPELLGDRRSSQCAAVQQLGHRCARPSIQLGAPGHETFGDSALGGVPACWKEVHNLL